MWLTACAAACLLTARPAGAQGADENIEAPGKTAPSLPVLDGLRVSGYVQAQLESSKASEDQVQQGGASLNQERYSVRRARLRVDRTWENAQVSVELDGNTTRGLAAGFRRAEVAVFLRSEGDVPYVRASAGLGDIPFGRELSYPNRDRLFMERTALSQAFFPYEADVGASLSGGLGPFRYVLSVLNGQPFGDPSGPATAGDPNAGKDLVARFGVDVEPIDEVRVTGATSFLRGRGYHQGSPAQKSSIIWRDQNENSMIDAGEVVGVPGTAATPSASFDRWAAGLDLAITVKSPVGATTLSAELVAGVNMDRGPFLADPVASGGDVRELGYYVALTHEVNIFLLGIRHDLYDPNADFFDKRAGKLLPSSERIRTTSPVAGVRLGPHARALVQYDIIRDFLARDDRGVPTDLANNRITVRLQGEL